MTDKPESRLEKFIAETLIPNPQNLDGIDTNISDVFNRISDFYALS